ncbi:MAG: penicillin-binding protein 1C [Thalassobius sp.]|nr:penicillin-binding protein 1C [Thalassovita sp.]
MIRFVRKYPYHFSVVVLILSIAYYFCLPSPLFETPYTTVLKDRNDELLGAIIADDGQWRFPKADSVPEKFKTAITTFEDSWFYYHPGFNPVSLFRATIQNISAGRVVSGGSTLSMQTIRLARMGKSRTFLEKFVEIILATRLELSYSKDEILALYSAQAPFGGNVVGLETASWRYFGRKADELSWGEVALLAVLPNQPSLLFPGKNEERLLKKRNRLIEKLFDEGYLDSLTSELAKSEPLPAAPLPQPALAPHLLTRQINEGKKGKAIKTTLSKNLQKNVNAIVDKHHQYLKANEIYNLAAMVIEVESGEVLAYVGNTNVKEKGDFGDAVDVITAPRSTGSIMKPFLYAAMLNEGFILPKTLLPDIPTYISGFAPQNFNRRFEGAVHADIALAKSLNIPAVRMLADFSVEKFYYKLKELGVSTLTRNPGHYGLSLILGGAEATLWDLAGVYAGMARTLNRFDKLTPYHYQKKTYFSPKLDFVDQKANEDFGKGIEQYAELSAASIWLSFEAMLKVYRPGADANWELYETSKKIAWKTGTSYGHRDAWSIGVTPGYVVAVWVGNADGEGRPGLTGLTAAAPVLFDIFDLLPDKGWFNQPQDEMVEAEVCRKSGYLATENCAEKDSVLIQETGIRTSPCPYEVLVHLDKSEKFQVSTACESVSNMTHKSYFVLPPVQEWYYRFRHSDYKPLPPYRSDCLSDNFTDNKIMQMIYPVGTAKVFIPRELDGKLGNAIFEVAHRKPSTKIYWHLDEEYLGETVQFHEMAMQPSPGKHTLTLVDENGEVLEQNFEVAER